MFPSDIIADATALVAALKERQLMLALAESCTGGLVAGVLTEVPGSSDILDRGFVTYSNEAKISMLGVRAELITQHGAVSAEVARAMAEGALAHSRADLAIAITGIAGPGGGTATKPVGLVHFAVAQRGAPALHRDRQYHVPGRTAIRLAAVRDALDLLSEALGATDRTAIA